MQGGTRYFRLCDLRVLRVENIIEYGLLLLLDPGNGGPHGSLHPVPGTQYGSGVEAPRPAVTDRAHHRLADGLAHQVANLLVGEHVPQLLVRPVTEPVADFRDELEVLLRAPEVGCHVPEHPLRRGEYWQVADVQGHRLECFQCPARPAQVRLVRRLQPLLRGSDTGRL